MNEIPAEAPILLEPAVILPGGAGVPPIETPPPSSEFTPVGGPTGSDATLPPIAPPATGANQNPSSRTEQKAEQKAEQIVRLAKISEATTPEDDPLALGEVLRAVSPDGRAVAAQRYWQYASQQTERIILDYQRQIFDFLGEKIFRETANTSDMALAGLLLEQHVLTLRTAQIELELRTLETAWELARRTGLSWGYLRTLPLAETAPKVENFQYRLDQFQPGSQAHKQAVERARQLDYAASQLAVASGSLPAITQWLAAPDGKIADTPLAKTLDAIPVTDYALFFGELKQARIAGAHYLRLVQNANERLAICVSL